MFSQSIEFSIISKIGAMALIISYFTLLVSGAYSLKTNQVYRKLLVISMILITVVVFVFIYSLFDKSQYGSRYLYPQ